MQLAQVLIVTARWWCVQSSCSSLPVIELQPLFGTQARKVNIKAQKFGLLSLSLALFALSCLASVHALDHLNPGVHHESHHAPHDHSAHGNERLHSSWLNDLLHEDQDEENASHCGLWLASLVANVDVAAAVFVQNTGAVVEIPDQPAFSLRSALRLRPPGRAPPVLSS